MKFQQITSLLIIILLVFGTCSAAVIALSEPLSPVIGNEALPVSCIDALSSCGMPDGSGYDPLPAGFNCTGSAIYFTLPDTLSDTHEMDCGDADFAQLHSNLDPVLINGILEKEGAYYSLYLPVVWDFSTVDTAIPGSYTACGIISLPSGAVLAEGLESTINIEVQVKSPPDVPSQPEKIVLTSFDEQYRMDAVAFAQGTSLEELSEWFAYYYDGFTGYDSQGNAYDLMTDSWSLEDIDTNSSGVYYAWAPPDLEEDYTLGDGIPIPRLLCAVSIQNPDRPDINCCVSARGFLLFPWVLSTEHQEQLDQFTVRIWKNDGIWEQLDENSCIVISDGLYLSQRMLEHENTYGLQVLYPGGQTGILTFEYDGELTILDYSGGDRDGGDVNGTGPSTGSQPAPEPAQTPGTSSPEPNETQTPVPREAPKDSSPISTEATVPVSDLLSVSDPVYEKTLLPVPTEQMPEPSIVSTKPAEQIPMPSAVLTGPVSTLVQNAAPSPQPKPSVAVSSFQAQYLPGGQNITETANDSQNSMGARTEERINPPETGSEIQESYSPARTVISGLRLRDLCTGEKNVIFGASSLTVSIPSQLLLALRLSDTDTLSVELTQPEQNKVALAVNAPGKIVSKLSGTILRLRYTPQSETSDITVLNEAGTKASDTEFDGEYLRFTIDAPGTYTILEKAAVVPEGSQSGRSSMLPLVLAVLAGLPLAAGAAVFIRRS